MPGLDGSVCATGRSRAALGGVLGIRAVNGHPTVSSAVPFAPLSSRLPGSGDGFSPCLQTVSDDSCGLVLTAGCHRLTTPCQGPDAPLNAQRATGRLHYTQLTHRERYRSVMSDFPATQGDSRV